jgi:3' terminal RNA ribose 2'-O-methyltransferase Hen1
MLLSITNLTAPATDLGHLLRKHPDRVQAFPLPFGTAHVYYPEADPGRCTAALLLEVDPVGLVRNRRVNMGDGGPLQQYVNDRPYVASSLMSVAIARTFADALSGKSKEKPGLAGTLLDLEARIEVMPCRGGEGFLRRIFEPLSYEVRAVQHPLDAEFPEWGEGPYFTVTLKARTRLQDLLTHLYVLMPVLDNAKHYWVGDDEIEKLLERGKGWLENHPEKDAIVGRYLRNQKRLARLALTRLNPAEEGGEEDPVEAEIKKGREEAALEEKLNLNDQRMADVVEVLKASGAKRILDLGCGEGKLLRALLKEKAFTEIVGVDVSTASLEYAKDRLNLDEMPPKQRERISLMQGSLTYRDKRLAGYDAAAVVEVIEHLDLDRLDAFERSLFGCARPAAIVLTTPNAEYNARFANLPSGKFRHRDHRFEWTRAEFQDWALGVAQRHGYTVGFRTVGPVDAALGSPTQMGVFSL